LKSPHSFIVDETLPKAIKFIKVIHNFHRRVEAGGLGLTCQVGKPVSQKNNPVVNICIYSPTEKVSTIHSKVIPLLFKMARLCFASSSCTLALPLSSEPL
jgi:hypothetical protein